MDSQFEVISPDHANSQITLHVGNNQDTVEDLLYEFIRGRPKTTGRSYKQDLQDFLSFTNRFFQLPRVVGRQVHFEDIKRVHVVKYQNFLEQQVTKLGKPLAPNSINRKISSVSSFYQFLLQRDVVDKNPVEFCKRPKRINVRDTEAFNETEMKDFFRLVIRKAPPLHRGALLLLFTTGMRNHELRNIKLSDFENREGVKVLRYIGKGQKLNQVPIHPVTGYHLGQYLDFMPKSEKTRLKIFRSFNHCNFLRRCERHEGIGASFFWHSSLLA